MGTKSGFLAKGHSRSQAFENLVAEVEERDEVKPKDIAALAEIAVKGSALHKNGEARILDFYAKFQGIMNKRERTEVTALLEKNKPHTGLAASVSFEHSGGKYYPALIIRGVLPDATNSKPSIVVKTAPSGDLTIVVGTERKSKVLGPVKKTNVSFSEEIELTQHTSNMMFNVRVVDPLGNELFKADYDTDE